VALLFGSFSLDHERRELTRRGQIVAVEPQVFDLLLFLVQRRDRVVSKHEILEAVWGGRIVSDSTLTSRINAARRALGDSGARQEMIRTVARKGFRFVASVTEEPKEPVPDDLEPAPSLRQEVQFCTAADGTRIAYASAGEGAPLVKAANWLNHLEYDWKGPIWKHFFAGLAADRRLVRYDARGNGLSDRDVTDFSFDAFVDDLECVVEASGLDRFALLGVSQGCAVSVAYAVRHPERVTHLVLYGGYARGWCKHGSPTIVRQMEAIETMMRQGWGRRNPAFRQFFTTAFIPGANSEQMQWFNELQRKTASAESAANIMRSINSFDVDHLLPQVQAPTLVLHCRGDAVCPFEEGRRLAAGIPGARFVALDSSNHLLLEDDPAFARFLGEVRDFLRPAAMCRPEAGEVRSVIHATWC
jgi:pimeloyl-ACP methyl ester carboxylesterase/DNA-binding winged helix-turn-helix (wHTH) protein